jgi:hypothetical protein
MTRALVAGFVLAEFAATTAWATGTISQQPGASGSWSLTWPTSPGTSGYVLSTDGTGVTSWIPDAGTASTAFSSITAGSATDTTDSTNKAQIWNWNSLSTQTASAHP